MSRAIRFALAFTLMVGICVPNSSLLAFAEPADGGGGAPAARQAPDASESAAPNAGGVQEQASPAPSAPAGEDALAGGSADALAVSPALVGATAAVRSPQSSSPIWANGATGSDDNPGTEAEPVKTFAKAKELLTAAGASAIYVSGALTPAGTETWDLAGKTLARGTGYKGELVHVGTDVNLTLQNIVLDGRSGDGETGVVDKGDGSGGSLVGVVFGTLTVAEGAVLQNNAIESKAHWYPESGGAVFAGSPTFGGKKTVVNIEGGIIRNNSAVQGGGVFATGPNTVVNMSAGTIANNKAIEGDQELAGHDPNDNIIPAYGGSGGGVCIHDGADMNLSGGTISKNYAAERGGGISVANYYVSLFDSDELTMTGGSIEDNTAAAGGGGIFVQAGLSGQGDAPFDKHTPGIARITGGSITGNAVAGNGLESGSFGGGGIYVNGYSAKYKIFANGELYLSNVEVTGNHAKLDGGGYAACPVSVTDISLTNGSAFYGNTTDAGKAREIYILASNGLGAHSGDPSFKVSPSMLGGGAYKWVYDDGTEVPLDALQGVLKADDQEELRLSNALSLDGENDADRAAVQRARDRAQVRINNNTSAKRGGGIGTNGSVTIGTSVDTTEISLTKKWSDVDDKDQARPDSIKVNLLRDGEYVGFQTVKPDAQGNWATTFKNLPKADLEGHEYAYTVEEREVEGYTGEVTGTAADGFAITNTRSVSVKGAKVWSDGDDADGARPASITVELSANGKKVAETEVTAGDGWAFEFAGLAKYDVEGNEITYTVGEAAVPGYTVEVAGDAQEGFTITNTRVPSTPPEKPAPRTTPQTGDGSVLPFTLVAAGLAAGAAALAARRRRTEEASF